MLAEGNYFNSVTTPSVSGSAGKEYFSTTAAYVSTCTSVLGHACQANQLVSSGSVSGADSSVLNTFGPEPAALRYVPMAASTVPAFVKDNAGVGIIH